VLSDRVLRTFKAVSDCRTALINSLRSLGSGVAANNVPNPTRVLNIASGSFKRGNMVNNTFRALVLPDVSLYLLSATIRFNM